MSSRLGCRLHLPHDGYLPFSEVCHMDIDHAWSHEPAPQIDVHFLMIKASRLAGVFSGSCAA